MANNFEPLSFVDLKRACTTLGRYDHPSRKSIVFGEASLLPKRRAPVFGTSGKTGFEQVLGHEAAHYGEFIPNPIGGAGLRRVPKGLEVETVEMIKEDRGE